MRLFSLFPLTVFALLSSLLSPLHLEARVHRRHRYQGVDVSLGVDQFFDEGFHASLKGKRIGLITNQTGVDKWGQSTIERFLQTSGGGKLCALFSPEHGLGGDAYAGEMIKDTPKGKKRKISLYSLYGKTRRPTEEMLSSIDVLICDIQDIGVRSYTYASTLFYAMEEAAKKQIPVIVLDRPNPMGGEIIDGAMLEEGERSIIGYVDVPYCHGMTIGELAHFFNEEYKVGCTLHVIPMKGWHRALLFGDTNLPWLPSSPHIPEWHTPFFYASTGILGELGLVNIGVGYTLPFQLIGAPWIDAHQLAKTLNKQRLPGVRFLPFSYRPFYGSWKGLSCRGILIQVTDPRVYLPVTVQYSIIGVLKSLYPKEMGKALKKTSKSHKNMFCKANGNRAMWEILEKEKHPMWPLLSYAKRRRGDFTSLRKKYLREEYKN